MTRLTCISAIFLAACAADEPPAEDDNRPDERADAGVEPDAEPERGVRASNGLALEVCFLLRKFDEEDARPQLRFRMDGRKKTNLDPRYQA